MMLQITAILLAAPGAVWATISIVDRVRRR
jgi:hypothetical protein